MNIALHASTAAGDSVLVRLVRVRTALQGKGMTTETAGPSTSLLALVTPAVQGKGMTAETAGPSHKHQDRGQHQSKGR